MFLTRGMHAVVFDGSTTEIAPSVGTRLQEPKGPSGGAGRWYQFPALHSALFTRQRHSVAGGGVDDRVPQHAAIFSVINNRTAQRIAIDRPVASVAVRRRGARWPKHCTPHHPQSSNLEPRFEITLTNLRHICL